MAKVLTILGGLVALLIFLAFAAEVALGVPFSTNSTGTDIGFMLAAAALGYLSWSTYREQI